MHKQRLFIVVGGAIAALGAFLPWAKVSLFGFSASAKGIDVWWGWLVVGLSIAAIGMAVSQGERSGELDAKMKKTIAGFGGGVLAASAYNLIDVFGTPMASPGIGLWLSLIGGLAVLAMPFVIKGDGNFEMPSKETIKADLDGNADDVSAGDTTA